MSDEIEISKIAAAAGTDSDTARTLILRNGNLSMRKENGRYVVPTDDAPLVLEVLRQNGKLGNEFLLLVLQDRNRWREKHDALEVHLGESRKRCIQLEEKTESLNAEVKEEAQRRAEAAHAIAERSDKTTNNAIQAIVESAKANALRPATPAPPSPPPPSAPQKEENGDWQVNTPLGGGRVPKAALPFVLLVVGIGLGWWFKAREAEAEIRARVENTKQIQEGTKALADIAKNQADQVKKDHEEAAKKLKEAEDAKEKNSTELAKLKSDYDAAQGALNQIKGDWGKDKDKIAQLQKSVESLQPSVEKLNAESARLTAALDSQTKLTESQKKLMETKDAQLKDHETTIAGLQKRLEELGRKPGGEKPPTGK